MHWSRYPSKVGYRQVFVQDLNAKGTMGHFPRQHKLRCARDRTKYFLSHRVVGRCDALEQQCTVDAPSKDSVKAFKERLDKLRHTRVSFL